MRTVQFNFNNEVDTFDVQLDEETGVVTIPGPNGETLAQYDSMQQFAEMYATARDVVPENLKNWTLIENGDVISFVLRAGTAGVTEESIHVLVEEVMESLRTSGEYHPLDVERLRREVAGAADIMQALAASTVRDLANAAYDRLDEMGAFEEPEAEPEEVDGRSEMEKYLDSVLETDKTLAFFARLLGLDGGASKEDVLGAFGASSIPYTPEMVKNLYEDALEAAGEGINVNTRMERILVVSQAVPGIPSAEAKTKIITMANIAKREKANVTAYTVGRRHIRKSATLVTILELNDMDLYMMGSLPMTVTFDPSVDEELEEERRAAEEAAEAEARARRAVEDEYLDEDDEDGYDEDGYEDGYEDAYDDDDEDEYDYDE